MRRRPRPEKTPPPSPSMADTERSRRPSSPRRRIRATVWGFGAVALVWGSVAGHSDPSYPWIREDQNLLLSYFEYSPPNLQRFFAALDRLRSGGSGKIRIVHIGDSHVQAGFFPGRVRELLESFTDTASARGMVFPYRVAGTNGPQDYTDRGLRGSWRPCRNVERGADCPLGVTGISLSTASPDGRLWLELDREQTDTAFDVVRVFHSPGPRSMEVVLRSAPQAGTTRTPEIGLTRFDLPAPMWALELGLRKSSAMQRQFVLYGISLENRGIPGIVYHSMGINGAGVDAFLRCRLLVDHLRLLDPDLVLISLGTNEGSGRSFNRRSFVANMGELLARVDQAAPAAAVILTTPGESHRKEGRRRVPNTNTSQVRHAIFDVARHRGSVIWDFWQVMGGLDSVRYGLRSRLYQADKVHLTTKGYRLQGDLFFKAFKKAYDAHRVDEGTK